MKTKLEKMFEAEELTESFKVVGISESALTRIKEKRLICGDYPYIEKSRKFCLRLPDLKEGNVRMENFLASCYQAILKRLTGDENVKVEYTR